MNKDIDRNAAGMDFLSGKSLRSVAKDYGCGTDLIFRCAMRIIDAKQAEKNMPINQVNILKRPGVGRVKMARIVWETLNNEQ